MATGNTAGVDDVPAGEAWAHLNNDETSILIDVRTRAEWTFVGVPDLSSIGKRVVTLEWQTFENPGVNPAFTDRLRGLLETNGASESTELFFICRSGARSRQAAEAMAAAGFPRCHNVEDGFEGPLDADHHRGHVAGWKAAGLPWAQG